MQCFFLFQAWVGNKKSNTQYYSVSESVQLRRLLLRRERLQDLPGDQGQQGGRQGGARQGLGRVCQQQEESRATVAAEGGQGRGEACYLGLSCRPDLQTGSQVSAYPWNMIFALLNILEHWCMIWILSSHSQHIFINTWRRPSGQTPSSTLSTTASSGLCLRRRSYSNSHQTGDTWEKVAHAVNTEPKSRHSIELRFKLNEWIVFQRTEVGWNHRRATLRSPGPAAKAHTTWRTSPGWRRRARSTGPSSASQSLSGSFIWTIETRPSCSSLFTIFRHEKIS